MPPSVCSPFSVFDPSAFEGSFEELDLENSMFAFMDRPVKKWDRGFP
jgi:hypothetical protein